MLYQNLKFAKIGAKVSCKHRHLKVLARRHLASSGHVNGRCDFVRGGVKNSAPNLQSTGIPIINARQPEKQIVSDKIRTNFFMGSCTFGVLIGNLG